MQTPKGNAKLWISYGISYAIAGQRDVGRKKAEMGKKQEEKDKEDTQVEGKL